MIGRIIMMAISFAVVAYVITLLVQFFFLGGTLESSINSEEALGVATMAAIVGGVIGFFKKH